MKMFAKQESLFEVDQLNCISFDLIISAIKCEPTQFDIFMQNMKAQSCSALKTTLVQSWNIVGNTIGNRACHGSEYTSPLFWD